MVPTPIPAPSPLPASTGCRCIVPKLGRLRHEHLTRLEADAYDAKRDTPEPESDRWRSGLCGLVRRWLPKNTYVTILDHDDLDAIIRQINDIPRRSLQGETAADCYGRLSLH